MKKIQITKIKMNSIKTKITFIILSVVIVLSITLGAISSYLNYKTTYDALEQTMTETAVIAAERVIKEIESYKNVAMGVGSIKDLSDSDVSVSEKQKIIDANVKQYGFQRGNILDLNGISIFDGKDYSDRDYFKSSINGQSYASDPLISNITGKLSIIISAPLWKDGIPNSTVVGVVYFVPDEQFLNNIVRSINVGDTGDAYMLNKDGLTIAYKDESIVGVENTQELVKTDESLKELAAIEKRMINGETGFGSYPYDGINMLAAFAPIEGTNGWSITINFERSEFLGGVYTSIIAICIAVVIFILLGIIIARKTAKKISDPIKSCADRLVLLSHGDLTSVVPKATSNDETGILLNSLKTTIEEINQVIGNVSYHLGEIEKGNLTSTIEMNYEGDFAKLKISTESILNYLNEDMTQINQASEQVASGADQVSSGAQALSQGATEQASSVEELSATLNEISDNVKSNAQNSENARTRAVNLRNEISKSNVQMQDMIKAMDEINDSSNQIGKIIKAIEDIAFQTNILALNAAVEAARAGSAGKGFAVVADEVRNLASKSAAAAMDTTSLIEQSIQAVKNGKKLADETANSLSIVVEEGEYLTDVIEEISRASEAQAASIGEVTLGVEQVSAVVQNNSATAEESAAASEELSGQAQILKDLVGKYTLKSNKAKISKLTEKDNDRIENRNIICGCSNLTEKDLINAVNNGAKTFEEVQKITKVSTGCGKCKGSNEKLVNSLILKKKIDENQVVCGCYNVKVHDMIQAIKKGARSFEEVQKVTKAGTGCGGCVESNKVLVDELLAKY